jgi:outer membrane protein assembly factor BamB
VILCAFALQAAAKDWYQWRGPNRDGISSETGLSHDWSSDAPELLWRTKGLGKGMSSVAISNGKLYTLGVKNGETVLICRKLEDGREVWENSLGGKGNPNCTPTVDPEAGLVFGLTKDGILSCLKADSGEVVWTKSYAKDFGGKMMSGWGYSESPLVDGDWLICTPGAEDAMLVALDKRTGKTIWKTDTSSADLGDKGKDGAGYGSPVISNGGGVKQYVQMVGRGLVSIAADDGRLLWNYNRIANGTANIPTAIVTGDQVFGSTGYGDGGSALLKLSKSGNGVKAEEVYYKGSKELQNHHGGMILVGGKIYLGDGHNNGFPQCVDLNTGDILWDKARGAGSGSAAITYADGHLFFRYENHVMALIEANPDGYQLKGSFKIDSGNGKSWPHPVIQNGKLYLRDQDELLCYDVSE